jgi:hypothetical protein
MSTTTTERAREAAGTAAEEGQRVAETAKQEAAEVAGEAKEQARQLLDQAATQVNEQTLQQRDRLVETLTSVGRDLQSMASQSDAPGLAADLAREVADRCRSLSSRIEGREPQELLDDVRGFARQRPGTFLLGALAAGVVAGRLARSAKAAASDGGASSPGTTPSADATPSVTGPSLGGVGRTPTPASPTSAQASVGAPDPLASQSTPGQRTQPGDGGSTS